MSKLSKSRSEEFLKICHQFQLGDLTTEKPHPVTANLSQAAQEDITKALRLLFQVDSDVLETFRAFAESGRASDIASTVFSALKQKGKIFFTGCGSTGRLSIQLVSIWRDFWQRQAGLEPAMASAAHDWEQRAFSAMAGGDYALIKSVEGFEDYTAFGKRQLQDLGVSSRDVVFAITEGGETSFVIGTAWQGLEAGAKVYFVYNNPDDVLRRTVERSREVLDEPRIEKINLTTGPMSITGSTRMQATTIQLCVMLTVLEMVVRDRLREIDAARPQLPDSAGVPSEFLARLTELFAEVSCPARLKELACLVHLEENAYRGGRKNNYFADRFAIDVLTDTTERSPTYCTPPFRKFDDPTATASWAFLFVPPEETSLAWEGILKRSPACVEWDAASVQDLVGEVKAPATNETIRKISRRELMRFKVGLDGLRHRPLADGDIAVGVVSQNETDSLLDPRGFHRVQLEAAHRAGAQIGLMYFGIEDSADTVSSFAAQWSVQPRAVIFRVPKTSLLLDGVTRVGVKTVLNALSTCTMVRLGRVMGNCMIWVVPSNLKLIDRATRYIQNLTGLAYRDANELLFEVIEFVEPRMKSDQAYPPVVGVAVLRARESLSNDEAEARLLKSNRGGTPSMADQTKSTL